MRKESKFITYYADFFKGEKQQIYDNFFCKKGSFCQSMLFSEILFGVGYDMDSFPGE